MSFSPLEGLRVIDVTQVLAGPYATYQLALMGAEVIKIELPERGDWTRSGGPVKALADRGLGLSFCTQNSNKRSVSLDLKRPEGRALALRLAASADIFVENMRPSVADRLGIGFEAVAAVKPDIVYCSISAFGQDGPMGTRPAYDHVVQGMCGIMGTTGTEATGPTKVGAPYVDYATGLNGALAIVSALHETRRTGQAVRVDVAMLDTALLLMSSLMTNHISGGWVPKPSGNQAWSGSPSSGEFETADGTLMLAANNEPQFRRLCQLLECPHVLEDPRWAEPEPRRENAPALRALFAERLSRRGALEWEQLLHDHLVPGGKLRTLDETLAEEQIAVRGLLAEVPLPGHEGGVHVPALGFKVNGSAVSPAASPPELGADTDAVLAEIGLGKDEISVLRGSGVI